MSVQPIQFSGSRCRACDRVHREDELDEYGWCPECRSDAERKVRVGKHVIAGLVVLPFAVWVIVLSLQRSGTLPLYAWLLPLAAAYYLGMRIGREALRGYVRWRRTR